MKLSHPSMKRASTLMLCAGVVLLTACASFKPKTPEEIVKERATARWQAMIPRDFAKAYTFLAPSYRKIASAELQAAAASADKPPSVTTIRGAGAGFGSRIGGALILIVETGKSGAMAGSSGSATCRRPVSCSSSPMDRRPRRAC